MRGDGVGVRNNGTRKWGFFVLRLMISGGLIGFLLWKVDRRELVRAILEFDPLTFFLIFMLMLVTYVLPAFRIDIILKGRGVFVEFYKLVYLYFLGQFFSLFLPTGIGGDIVRIVKMMPYTKSRSLAAFYVLFDRFLALFVVVILGAGMLFFIPAEVFGKTLSKNMLMVVSAVLFGGALFVLTPWFRAMLRWNLFSGRFQSIGETLRGISDELGAIGKGRLAAVLIVSAFTLVMNVVMNYFVAQVLEIDVSLGYLMVVVPVSFLIMMLPINIGGLGIREAVYVMFLGCLGVSPARAMAMSLVIYVLIMMMGLLGGLLFIWDSRIMGKVSDVTS